MLQPEEIGELSEYLRREGFKPSLYQVLAAQEVVRRQSSQDSGLGSLVRLTTLLRPVFSSTPEQQERFEALYLEWLRRRSGRPRTIPAGPPALPPPEQPKTHWRMKLAVPCLLILPALTTWFLWQELRPREAVGRVVADNQPVAPATVRLGEQTATTDEQGMFTVPFKNDDMPLQLLVEMKGYIPSHSQVGQGIVENKKWFYLSPVEWDVQYQLGDVQLAQETVSIAAPSPPPAPVQQPTPPKLSLEKLRTVPPLVPTSWERLSFLTAFMALAPSLLVLPWLLYRFTRRAVLKRQSSRIPPELKRIQIQAGSQRLFPSLSLRHVTQRLRQPRFEESVELDVHRTIQRTVQRGGLFTPAFGSKREPSYVALIDRSTLADHQANVAAQLVKDLARGSVLVRHYEFDEEPTIVRVVDPLRPEPKHGTGGAALATMVEVMSLGEVQAKFPTSRLLYFADPLTCFDPLTGKLRPWMETLETWEERFLFTTGAHGQWGQAARILNRRGFQVIPLTHLGLRFFSHLVEQSDARPTVSKLGVRERWSIYDRMPERWLDRHPPSRDTITRLLDDLRRQLEPEGFLWLAACAAYPEIHWALTLEWGTRLFGLTAVAESLLPKLTPLIWFRQAFMPDWFRQALYERLSGQEADRISQELGEILSALHPRRGDQLQLHIAAQPGTRQTVSVPVGQFTAWFQKFRLRSALQEMGQVAEPSSPMHDYVMLQFLSGRQGKALTPYAPKALLTVLFPKGQPWLRFRPLFLVMAAGIVSAVLWWSENPAPIPLTSPIQEIGFLPETEEVILNRENGRVERWGRKDWELVLLEAGEEGLFHDRLAKVQMGRLTVPDPTGQLGLTYQKEGQLLVVSRDGQELAREAAPAAQTASLSWCGTACLVVARENFPELVKFNGLETLYAQASKERRQTELAAKKKSDEVLQSAIPEKKQQLTKKTKLAEKPASSMDIRQSNVRESELPQSVQQQPEAMIQAQSSGQQPHSSETPQQQTTVDVKYVYGETKSDESKAVRRMMEKNRVLEALAATFKVFILQNTLILTAAECGEVKAYYQPSAKTLTICYDLISNIARKAANDSNLGNLDRESRVGMGAVIFIVFHQFGHALIDLLNLPIVGREEDVADQIAAYVIMNSGNTEVEQLAMMGAMWLFERNDDVLSGTAFADEHSLNKQRYYNIICWAFGKDANRYAYLQGYLKGDRADRCKDEFTKMNKGIATILQFQPQPKITGKDSAPMATDGGNPSSLQATPFQVLVNQVYNHPSYPTLRFRFDGEMVFVMHEKGPIPLAMLQVASFPDGQWVSLQSIDQNQLPIMVMRHGRSLTAQWLP